MGSMSDLSASPNYKSQELPPWLLAELRSDHAGETGAVWIYRGILAFTSDAMLRKFATHHLNTEAKHLALISNQIPRQEFSSFIPVWKLAGFLTGAIPAICGNSSVYATIDAVETFVDSHYQHQIDRLRQDDSFPALRELLEQCQADELEHRDEARAAIQSRNPALNAWCWLVGYGSGVAVKLARWR